MKATRMVLGVIAVIAALTTGAYAASPDNGRDLRVPGGEAAGELNGEKCVTITVESPPSGGIYNYRPVLRIHYHDVTGGINRGYYQIDGCAGPSWTEIWSYNCGAADTTVFLTLPSVSEGIHAVHFKATDDVGVVNTDSCSLTWTFTYDATRPSYQVASPASGGVYAALPALTVHFADDRGLDRAYYQVDGCEGGWTSLWLYNSGRADTTILWTPPAMGEGVHTVYFRIDDDAGNANGDTCSSSWNFTYDYSRPTITVNSPTPGGVYSSPPALDIHVADNTGLNRAYYQLDGCDGAWTELWPYDAGTNDTTITWIAPVAPAGNHEIHFKVSDDAGNINLDSCSYSWPFAYIVATVALSPSIIVDRCGQRDTLWITLNEEIQNVKAAYFRLGYDDAFITPVSVIKGPGLTPPVNSVIYPYIYPDSIAISLAMLTGTINGPAAIIGVIYDAGTLGGATAVTVDSSILRDSNNQDIFHAVSEADVTIDCTRPTVVVTGPASGGLYNVMPTVNLAFHDNNDLNRGYYQIDGCTGPWMELWPYNSGQADTAVSWTVPTVSKGTHTIYFKAMDDAGNGSLDSCSVTWSFTYRTPVISLAAAMPLVRCGVQDTIWIEANGDMIDIKGAYIRLGYDDGYVTPLAVINGPVLQPPSNYVVYSNIYPDSVVINLAALVGDFDGPGRMLGVIVTGSAEVASTPITVDNSVLRDPGNQSIPHTTVGTVLGIDCTRPTVVVTGPASGGLYNVMPTVNLAFHDNNDLNRGYYQIDGCTGPWMELWPYNSGQADTAVSWTVPTVSVGTHTVHFRIADDAGNMNADTCSYTWTFVYEVIPPTVTVLSPASGGVYNTSPNLNLALHDNIGINRGYYQVDGCTGSWIGLWSYNSGQADTTFWWIVPSLPVGSHTIHFKVIDDAGNINSDTCTYTWSFTYGDFMCGDANGNMVINVADAVFIVNYIFRGGPAPNPLQSGDANCDGKIAVGDAVYIVSYIFRDGPAPCCP